MPRDGGNEADQSFNKDLKKLQKTLGEKVAQALEMNKASDEEKGTDDWMNASVALEIEIDGIRAQILALQNTITAIGEEDQTTGKYSRDSRQDHGRKR